MSLKDFEVNHQGQTQAEVFPTIPEKGVKHLREQFHKRNECRCGFIGIHGQPIKGYYLILEDMILD